jgi:hypothetical protein
MIESEHDKKTDIPSMGKLPNGTNENEKEGLHLSGIEPPHVAPEATALSTELQVHV